MLRVAHSMCDNTSPCSWRKCNRSNATIRMRRIVQADPRNSPGERGALPLLVEGVKDYAIFMLDPDGYITTWNLGAQRIKGYEFEEIMGEHFW
jgi:PAS domain-containing protein